MWHEKLRNIDNKRVPSAILQNNAMNLKFHSNPGFAPIYELLFLCEQLG